MNKQYRQRAALLRLAFFGVMLAGLAPAWADGQTKVSLQAVDQPIRDCVTELAEQAKVKLKIQAGVRGSVSLSIKKVAFEDALSAALNALGYSWRKIDGLYVIGRFGLEGERKVTVTIPLKRNDPVLLARSFGWLDLSCLAPGTPPVTDLRDLLAPGLDGPPRPLVDKHALEITGQGQAVADFKRLVADIERTGDMVRWRYLVAKISGAYADELAQRSAQGKMNFGRTSDDREALYSCHELDKLYALYEAGHEGVSVLAKGTVSVRDLQLASTTLGTEAAPLGSLTWIANSGDALSLKLWAKASVKLGDATVELSVDGGKLPPEEGVLVVSRAKYATQGAEPVLVMLVPRVKAGEE